MTIADLIYRLRTVHTHIAQERYDTAQQWLTGLIAHIEREQAAAGRSVDEPVVVGNGEGQGEGTKEQGGLATFGDLVRVLLARDPEFRLTLDITSKDREGSG